MNRRASGDASAVGLRQPWNLGLPRDLSGWVVVITGASSGIGRASAHACAERAASVVLAARSAESLRETAAECEAAGGTATIVPTDVTDPEAVHALARTAQERHGHVDVWVNNAAVMAYGTFENMPADIYRKVVDTNFFGQVHGARAVLPYFRAQGHGVLINVASLYAKLGSPYVGAYVAGKYAIRGFAECLRQEVLDARDIYVCTVFPGAVDTPIFRHVANYTGRPVQALPPVVDPQRVVRAVLGCIAHPRAEVTVGEAARVLAWGHAALPRVYDRLAPRAMNRVAFGTGTAESGPGNVFRPMPEWNQVDGQWREERTRIRHVVMVGGVAGALAASAAARLFRRRTESSGGS